MKWIVVLLLLANVGYFGYQTFVVVPPVTKSVVKKDDGQLKLLSEVGKTAKQTASDNKDSKAGKQAAKTESSQEVVANSAEAASDTDISTSNTLVVTKFVSCVTMADSPDKSKIEPLISELPDDFAAEVISYIEPGPTMYRVYVPPLEDKTAVVRAIRQLESNGFNDHYVMSLDGKPFAIALGVFSKESSAEGVADQIKKLKLKANVVEVEPIDDTTLYALQVKSSVDQKELLEEVTKRLPDQEETIRGCEEQTSEEQTASSERS